MNETYPFPAGDTSMPSALPPPSYKLFDSGSVVIATLLGSPIAGTLLMGVNYHRLKMGSKAALSILLGILATVFAIWFGNKIPTAFSTTTAIGLLLCTWSAAKTLQGPIIADHTSRGGKLSSRWASA